MRFYIYTKVIDRDGRTIADTENTDFITALDYIRADELQEVEYRAEENEPDSARLIFSGKNKGRTIEVTITEAEGITLPGVFLYDIDTRIYWKNKEIAKGQEISFIELLGYIKVNRHEIIKKNRGNLPVNEIAFYCNFAGRENRRNRIEATITEIEE